jgi:hypothetical protein
VEFSSGGEIVGVRVDGIVPAVLEGNRRGKKISTQIIYTT